MEAYKSSITSPVISLSSNTSSSSSYGFPSTTITSPLMDRRIWSRLPQRLLDRVIAFLPPPAFFRARSVCKSWYSLLFSDSFLEMYLHVSPSNHWFIFFKQSKSPKSYIYRSNSASGKSDDDYQEGYVFDPLECKWYHLSFALVPSGFSPAASSGGLICWVSDEASSKRIILCNPLTRCLTPLPPTAKPRLFPSIGLTVTTSSITVSVAGDDLISPFAVKNLTTENFHINSGGFYSVWGTTSSLPRLCNLESGRMVFADGRFYCMNYSPFSVLAYNVNADEWCKIQAPMRRFIRYPSLVESRGKLILVAAVEKSKLNVPRSMRLWTLQPCGKIWVEMERMPQQLQSQFEEVEGGNGFDCVGHGDFIAITIRGSDMLLLFHVRAKVWQWIPQCPFIRRNTSGGGSDGDGHGLHGFAYDPKLAIPAIGLLHQPSFPYQSFNG